MKSILFLGLFMALFLVGTIRADGKGDHDDDEDPPAIEAMNTVVSIAGKSGKIIIRRKLPDGEMPDVKDGGKGPDGEKGKGDKDGGKKGGEHDKKGKGGKKGPRKTPPIEISMAEIKPKRMGGGKKDMKDFARQVFTLSAPQNTTTSGVAVVSITATTTLTALNDTVLKFIVYIIKENGTITIGDEVQDVTVGMVKFSLEVSGGTYNDDMIVDLAIKTRGKPKKRGSKHAPPAGKKRAPEFSLGGDSFMQMSELVKVDDGAWQTQCMGADNTTTYPVVTERKGRQIMSFCIPQFTSKAVIDPTFEAGNEAEGDDDDNAAGSVAWSLAVLLLSALFTTMGL